MRLLVRVVRVFIGSDGTNAPWPSYPSLPPLKTTLTRGHCCASHNYIPIPLDTKLNSHLFRVASHDASSERFWLSAVVWVDDLEGKRVNMSFERALVCRALVCRDMSGVRETSRGRLGRGEAVGVQLLFDTLFMETSCPCMASCLLRLRAACPLGCFELSSCGDLRNHCHGRDL